MLSKLPNWIWLGMWVLAFVAGMVNGVAILGFQHLPVSHFTGNTSNLGIAIADHDLTTAGRIAAVMIAFVLGTILSGWLIKDDALRLGRSYGVSLFIECCLLSASVPLLGHSNPTGMYLLAAACGLQNAMASTYSGSIVRTTHVTGMFTDIGIFLGQRLAGVPADIRRFKLGVIIIAGFLLGGIAAAVCFKRIAYESIYIPAGITGMASLSYSVYRIRRVRRARNDLHERIPDA